MCPDEDIHSCVSGEGDEILGIIYNTLLNKHVLWRGSYEMSHRPVKKHLEQCL